MKPFRPLLPLVLLCAACAQEGPDRRTRELLSELDGYVQAREMYVAKKKDQMEALSRIARGEQNPEIRFDMAMRIADEYFAFSFDSTQAWLKHCIALAGEDREKADRASLRLGRLYSKSGNYMEAYQVLYGGRIDSTRLSASLKEDYLLALYDFSHDLSGNSGMVERLSIPPETPYRERLLRLLPAHSETWRVLLRNRFIDEGRLASADSVSRLLLQDLRQEDRNFAIHAYFHSEIAERDGRPEDRLTWLVAAAESDILNAVKDYAALTLTATLVAPVDIEHAFQYLHVAQEDALFYNARLRPWQISRSLMQVEDAYMARQVLRQKMLSWLLVMLGILSAAFISIAWFLVYRSRKLTRLRKELEDANARLATANVTLNELNLQISRADQVKQTYIVDFLQDLAHQIAVVRAEDNRYRNLLRQGKADELLKELSITGRSEKTREEFYETFDKTFLGMFPDFVAEFNALLRDDAWQHPPKGRLNTELRIFALIRLGVDDSKKIASMLDYSLSTIYNYKVAVKNSARGDRNRFEQQVKDIGK